MKSYEQTTKELVEAILADLKGRKGVGNELEQIDDQTYIQMVADLEELAYNILVYGKQ